MDAFEKNRIINNRYPNLSPQEGIVNELQMDFAAHFMDSPDYESGTMVDGKVQRLLVSSLKDDVYKKKIIAYPGETFVRGSVVDCYGAKWLITQVDTNRKIYTRGIMEQCNRELVWQNPQTREIIRRWCTCEKPYTSNLKSGMKISVSNREYKIQIPYDDETRMIDLDKRFLLEEIGGQPKAYICTSVDVNTDRYEDGMNGFITLNLSQDYYDANTDNAALMVADYLAPDSEKDVCVFSPLTRTLLQGIPVTFSATFYQNGAVVDGVPTWTYVLPVGLENQFTIDTSADGVITILAHESKKTYQKTVQITATLGEFSKTQELKVVIGF